jgi:hypothetical protein
VVEVGTLALMMSIVAGSLAWTHYFVLLTPLFFLAAARALPAVETIALWVCLTLVWVVPLNAGDLWPISYGFRVGVTALVVYATLVAFALRTSGSRPSQARVIGGRSASP